MLATLLGQDLSPLLAIYNGGLPTRIFPFLYIYKKTEFVFTYVHTYVCVSVCPMCVGTQGVHKGVGAPAAGGTGAYELPQ